MKSIWFVPYSGKKPAAMSINGHRLLILSKDRSAVEEGLGKIGADNIRKVKGGDSRREEEAVLEKLARSVKGGVVIAPTDLEVSDLISNLETQLPWLQ